MNNLFNKLKKYKFIPLISLPFFYFTIFAQNGSVIDSVESNTSGLSTQVLKLALTVHENAEKMGQTQSDIETVVDFTMPSNKKRLWVIDTKTGQVLYNTWVAHGTNTGMGANAQYFSNQYNSHESSIGVYKTGVTYNGSNGYSLHLFGLDKGFNDNAYNRNVVVHGATYVSEDNVKKYNQVGHSWGCFALSTQVSKKIIDTIKNDSILVAYYPNKAWLHDSKYI